jgi:KDEL-tailed cysteine endopeptidase
LLDCTTGYGNAGCNGGLMSNCYNYLRSYKLQQESSYPYIAYRSNCKYNSNAGVVAVRGYVNIAKNSVNAHLQALAQQPLSVAIAASSGVFQFYRGGIISSTSCGTSLNHAVTMIGYGTDANGVKFWTVKNSWGTNWGEGGYFRILRSSTDGVGVCNILGMSSYPVL